jgi:hypothetical protein
MACVVHTPPHSHTRTQNVVHDCEGAGLGVNGGTWPTVACPTAANELLARTLQTFTLLSPLRCWSAVVRFSRKQLGARKPSAALCLRPPPPPPPTHTHTQAHTPQAHFPRRLPHSHGAQHTFLAGYHIHMAHNTLSSQATTFTWRTTRFSRRLPHAHGVQHAFLAGYHIHMAHNTLYTVGSRSHGMEVNHGWRGCDVDTVRCNALIAQGAWGALEHQEIIPNRHVAIVNNVLYNPEGASSQWSHFALQGAAPPVPAVCRPAARHPEATCEAVAGAVFGHARANGCAPVAPPPLSPVTTALFLSTSPTRTFRHLQHRSQRVCPHYAADTPRPMHALCPACPPLRHVQVP